MIKWREKLKKSLSDIKIKSKVEIDNGSIKRISNYLINIVKQALKAQCWFNILWLKIYLKNIKVIEYLIEYKYKGKPLWLNIMNTIIWLKSNHEQIKYSIDQRMQENINKIKAITVWSLKFKLMNGWKGKNW